MVDQGEPLANRKRYKRLVGKLISLLIYLIYLFAIGIISHFMQNPCINHLNVIVHILR